MTNTKTKKIKAWYRYYHSYCPICGRDDLTKTLIRNEPKPKDYKLRHIEEEHYDYCNSL